MVQTSADRFLIHPQVERAVITLSSILMAALTFGMADVLVALVCAISAKTVMDYHAYLLDQCFMEQQASAIDNETKLADSSLPSLQTLVKPS